MEAIHAVLPLAKIVLVEAYADDAYDLAIAERTAAALPGVVAVSNSWGLVDRPGDPLNPPPAWWFRGSFDNPNVVYAAGAGDRSGPLFYPADDPGVIGVGGTILTHRHGRYTQRPWLSYTAGLDHPAKTGPDVQLLAGRPGLTIFTTEAFGGPTWVDDWGTSLATPLFCAVMGAVDGVRLARGESPLGTAQVLAGLTPGEVPMVPDFITRFA